MTMTTGRLGITGAMKSLDDPPKKPSNSSRAGAIDLDHHSDHSRRRSDDYHVRIIGQDLKKLKRANPQADQTMTRQGLVTSRATGG